MWKQVNTLFLNQIVFAAEDLMVIFGGHDAWINPDYGARYQARWVTFEFAATFW